MDRTIILLRNNNRNKFQSLGRLKVVSGDGTTLYSENSLERGWLDNKQMESCVPANTYRIVLEWSNRFKKFLWEIKGVPNRSECKIHAANYWNQLNGCIALGLGLADINGDGLLDVTRSKDAMKSFHAAMGEQTEAIIHIIDL